MFTSAIHGEAVEAGHRDPMQMGGGLSDLLQSLIQAESRGFTWVLKNGNNHLSEERATTLD
jgi:hypothetical protein